MSRQRTSDGGQFGFGAFAAFVTGLTAAKGGRADSFAVAIQLAGQTKK